MSASAVKWAKRQMIEDRTMTAVLAAIARLARNDVCEATQSQVADAAGIKERAARTSLSILEASEVIVRSRRQDWAKRGRSADSIRLSLDRDFHLTKEFIMGKRSMGPTGTECRMNAWDQPAPDAGAPTVENGGSLYKARTRSVLSPTSPHSSSSLPCSTRVRFDRQRGKWRASITVAGVTMELGRFDTEEEAIEYAAIQSDEVSRNSTGQGHAPRVPMIDPSKAKMTAPHIGAWLFGDEGAATAEGSGEADALGQGAKLLAGLGGAHERTEYDAAPAREVANDDRPFRQASFKLP